MSANLAMTLFQKVLPVVNFIIGTSALSFQMMVLYPWHHQLDADFRELKDVQSKKMQEYHDAKLCRLEKIEDYSQELLKLQKANSNK